MDSFSTTPPVYKAQHSLKLFFSFAPLPSCPAQSLGIVCFAEATMEDETREADQGPQLISIISEDPIGEEQGTLRV